MKKLMILFMLLMQTISALASTKDWTVLVYWAVDNDLYEFSKPYLHQFERVGSNQNLNIVVHYDLPASPSKRYFIHKANRERLPHEDLINSTLVETLPENLNSADNKTLAEFITWGKTNYPAKKYLVVLASHGSNWSGVIQDTTSSQYMSLSSLRAALENQQLDLILFDACKMSFIETIVGLNGIAPLMVGSPYDVDGFNHVAPLSLVASSEGVTPEELAVQYVNAYPAVESSNKAGTAASALYLKSDMDFINKLNAFIGQINSLSKRDKKTIFKHLSKTVNEDRDTAFDLFDLIETASTYSSALKLQATALLAQKNLWILSASSIMAPKFPSGLSITCGGNLKKYEQSAFGKLMPEWIELCSRWNRF